MSTSKSVWICHRCALLGADPVTEPESWNRGSPVTATARTKPSRVDNQVSGLVARSEVVARERGAA
jgi:hypothetical protein